METDHTKSLEIAGHLQNAIRGLLETSDEVAISSVVKDFTANTRDNILAKHIKPFLDQGKSKTVAEVYARNEPAYHDELERAKNNATEAEKVLRKDKALYAAYEANRSLLSLSKTIGNDLQG